MRLCRRTRQRHTHWQLGGFVVPGLFDRTAPACRDFAVVVEELLARRRGEAAQTRPPRQGWPRATWEPKRWTREELCDVAHSSYKALLKGSIRRPPRRAVVLAIADYLECTLAERNRLLVAAQYAPQQPYLTGADLTAVLALAQETVDYVRLPAYVVTREWDVRSTNAHLLTLFGATRTQVDAIPPEQRNILHLVFDPSLPLYERLSGTREAWERTARRSIYRFKRDNVLCQDEAWYKQRVQRLMGLPRFAEYWHQIQIDFEARSDGFGPACVPPDTIEITEELATLFQDTEAAHAAYEHGLGHRDEQWAAWYSETMPRQQKRRKESIVSSCVVSRMVTHPQWAHTTGGVYHAE
jgi:hypothetical protein